MNPECIEDKLVDQIFNAKPGTPEQEELEVIVMLIEKYVMEITGDFPDPDPIKA